MRVKFEKWYTENFGTCNFLGYPTEERIAWQYADYLVQKRWEGFKGACDLNYSEGYSKGVEDRGDLQEMMEPDSFGVEEPKEFCFSIEAIKVDVYAKPSTGFDVTRKVIVRVTHKYTGIFAECDTERGDHANRHKALQLLNAKLIDRKPILAIDVNRLRYLTQSTMADANKALTQANGDFDIAVKIITESRFT